MFVLVTSATTAVNFGHLDALADDAFTAAVLALLKHLGVYPAYFWWQSTIMARPFDTTLTPSRGSPCRLVMMIAHKGLDMHRHAARQRMQTVTSFQGRYDAPAGVLVGDLAQLTRHPRIVELEQP